MYFLADGELAAQYNKAHVSIESMRNELLPSILITNFFSVLIIAVAAAFVALRSSHKIAGPLFKVEKVINEISGGNLNMDVRFREADQLKSIGEALDNMVNNLSGKISEVKSAFNELALVSETIKTYKQENGDTNGAVSEIFESVLSSNVKLENRLKEFETKSGSSE